MLKKSVLWAFVAGLLLITLAACQKEPTLDPESSLPSVVSENSVTSIEASPSSQMESPVEKVPSEDASSQAPEASSQTESLAVSSKPLANYSYSSKAFQIKEVDPSNPPTTVTVQFTAEASNPNKTYSNEDFPGCDITVIEQGQYGGNTTLYPDGTPDQNDPILVYVKLKINQSGFENYEKVIQYLDQREDIALIGQTVFVISD